MKTFYKVDLMSIDSGGTWDGDFVKDCLLSNCTFEVLVGHPNETKDTIILQRNTIVPGKPKTWSHITRYGHFLPKKVFTDKDFEV